MRVVKNTLARKALAGTSFESIGPKLKGPLVLAFSKDDPGAAARVVKDFAKDQRQAHTRLSCPSAGRCCPAKDLDKVASLPTREQALSQLLGVHQGADREARAYARRAADQARPYPRRRPRPEAGRRRLIIDLETI